MSLPPIPEAHRKMLLRIVSAALAGLREKSDARKRCETRAKLRAVSNVEE